MQRHICTPISLPGHRDPIDGEAFMAMPEHLRGGWASEGEAFQRIYRTGDLVRWLPDGSLQVWVGWGRCLLPSSFFRGQQVPSCPHHSTSAHRSLPCMSDNGRGQRLLAAYWHCPSSCFPVAVDPLPTARWSPAAPAYCPAVLRPRRRRLHQATRPAHRDWGD